MPKEYGYDHMIKVLIVGDSGVGKTNMLLRFCQDNFMTSHLTTIGIDFKTKTLPIDGKKIRMQIWDTAGQERFKTITQTYYRGAMGIIMTYAVDDRVSFESIENWIKQIKLHSSHNVVKMLVGNKTDSNKREVSHEEGIELAKQLGVSFFQTSAKDNINIHNCFNQIARQIKNVAIEEDRVNVVTYTGSKIHRKNQIPEPKKKCCEN